MKTITWTACPNRLNNYRSDCGKWLITPSRGKGWTLVNLTASFDDRKKRIPIGENNTLAQCKSSAT